MTTATMTHTRPRVLSADTLEDTDVYNTQGEKLGEIEEFMIDLDSGQIVYAVLSFGGFFGLGDKLFAIPWPALEVDTEHEQIILDVDKDRLKNAPGFDEDNWPETPDEEWLRGVYSHYGYEYRR